MKWGVIVFILAVVTSWADQPIMNMMPRWDGGYGIQVLYDYIDREDLLEGDETIHKGWSETIQQVHIQGVYTWDRSIRITAKLPVVLDAERINLVDGQRVVQQDKGIGDLTLALPLKKYFNLMKRSGNWSVAPQIRVPLGSSDEYEVWQLEQGIGPLRLMNQTNGMHRSMRVGILEIMRNCCGRAIGIMKMTENSLHL